MVGVAVAVTVGVGVGVAVAVAVGVAVMVSVGVATAVPAPSPFMLTLSGLLLALLTMVSFADFLPSDDGAKTTDTSQSPSAARLATQLPEGTNSGFADATEVTSIAIEFGLWIVTVLGALALRGGRSPKLRLFGEAVRALVFGFLVFADGVALSPAL